MDDWDNLLTEQNKTSLLQRHKSFQHDHAVRESVRAVMNKIYRRGNECTEELLFLAKSAFQLSNNKAAKANIGQTMYDMQHVQHRSYDDAIARVKQVIYDIFMLGLDGLCESEKQLLKKQVKKRVNQFIVAIIEAYESAYLARFSKSLRESILDNGTFHGSCALLKYTVTMLGVDGIELTAGCALSDD